jgi:hypothetical protein
MQVNHLDLKTGLFKMRPERLRPFDINVFNKQNHITPPFLLNRVKSKELGVKKQEI